MGVAIIIGLCVLLLASIYMGRQEKKRNDALNNRYKRKGKK